MVKWKNKKIEELSEQELRSAVSELAEHLTTRSSTQSADSSLMAFSFATGAALAFAFSALIIFI